MIVRKVEEIQEGDVLAKDLLLEGEVLIPKGTSMKTSYVSNLRELNLELIYIEEPVDPLNNSKDKTYLESYLSQVTATMESLMHNNVSILKDLKPVAEEIVDWEISHFQENKKIILENREADLYSHSLNVCRMSVILSLKMGLTKEQINDIAFGALIHDVGYRYVLADYKNCDLDSMLPGEIFDIKKHTIYAFSSLESEEWISPLQKMIVLSHHERLDGSGYPLKQKKLEEGITIVGACDMIDSLVSGMACLLVEPKEALEVFRSCGDKFHKQVYETLIDSIVIE